MSRPNEPAGAVSSDDPPPYTEVASNGSVSLDEGAHVDRIRQWDVQTSRPSSEASSSHANAQNDTFNYAPPEGPPPPTAPRPGRRPSTDHRPPSGPPPSHSNPEKWQPPPRPPPNNKPNWHSGPPAQPPKVHPGHHASHGGPPGPPGPAPRPQLRYPPNYFCRKCHNTGIKVHKGTTCQDCFERFGVRSQAQYLPPGVMPAFNLPPRVVRPGDPSIGGLLCGRCRGAGIIRDFLLFESTCPICHGVGRVF